MIIFMQQYALENVISEMAAILYPHPCVDSSPPGQNGHHFADNIFRYIFVNEKFCTLIKISLKFVPKGSVDYKAALVRVMGWRRLGDRPLSEPMLTPFTDAYLWH